MNVPGANQLIQLEEVNFDAPVSSSVFNRMAAVVNKALASALTSSLGTVEISLLTQPQFQAIKSDVWVLMDGRDVTGSLYAAFFGVSTIPDFRSLFIRGKDNGANQDLYGELVTGFIVLQSQNLSHTHEGVLAIDQSGLAPGVTMVFTGYNNSIDAGGSVGGAKHSGPYFELPPVPGQFSTQPNGGNESRGKNITTNYFIKIN